MKTDGRWLRARIWSRSPEFRAKADAALARFNAIRPTLPKCGAKRRTDGEPCRNLPVKGGTRCRLHGGLTPRGDDWHRHRWPKRGPGAAAALERKLRDLEKRQAKRAARAAAMTPEERERHEARRQALQPRTAAERERRRQDRAAAKALAARRPEPRSGERRALDEQIADLELRIAIETGEGVFG